ncbi:MAG: hypothetical protein ACI95C_002365 [Pseudohongiellaceae bacterium]|jgi:hypothetical protein
MNKLLSLISAFALGFASYSYGQLERFSTQPFSLPALTKQLIVADMNGDNQADLLAVLDDRLRVYFQSASGFDFNAGFDEIVFADQSIGWDLSAGYHPDGQLGIVALVDGKTIQVWHAQRNKFQAGVSVQSNLNGFLGKGLNRLHFSRDINGDSLEDLVIPSAGKLNIYIRTASANYQAPLSIQADFRIRSNLESTQLDRRVGQAVRIPQLELRDVNGDQLDDLISRTEERLDVFLATASGNAYFPSLPSYSLNIEEIQERLGKFDIENVDFSNLTGILALTHEEILEDVNGDGIEDLLLREGGKVSLFAGTQTGMDLVEPKQVLRSGGNVLSTFLYDENEDGLKDLWLWRVEPISVGDVFMWLALSGSIAIEAFIYPNEGERFARRPSRKVSIDLKFPSVIRLASSFRELESEVKAAAQDAADITTIADFDATTVNKDVLLMVNSQLSLFMDVIEPSPEAKEFLGGLGYSRSQDSYQIDIKTVLDQVAIKAAVELTSIEGRSPDMNVPIASSGLTTDLIPARINGDEVDDLLVFETQESGLIKGLLLLSESKSQ